MELPDEPRLLSQLARMNVVFVGHVDHGKSTTIGRLCYDTGTLAPEKVAEIERVSRELGRTTEFAFILDHLEEERTGGLTIDTAQVFFQSPSRHYVIIDAPGHKEFLKNMLTGASQAEAALLVIDAAEGLREQSRRHAFLLSMLNIHNCIVVVNKMDLVGHDRRRYEALCDEVALLFQSLGVTANEVVPISAAHGDNVVVRSVNMPWYTGPTLLEALDALQERTPSVDQPLRLPVQDVYAIDGKRIVAGRVEAGTVRQGDAVVVVPGGQQAQVNSVELFGCIRTRAEAGESIGVTLDGDASPSRGDVLCDPGRQPRLASRLQCSVFWMAAQPLSTTDPLTLRLATQESACRVSRIFERIDSSTLEVLGRDAASLCETEVGKVVIETDKPVAHELFLEMAELGRFVLERGHEVVAGGTVYASDAPSVV